MWSGRFRQPLNPAFERWQRSFPFDCRLLKCELEASAAHARALGRCGLLGPQELSALLAGLEEIGRQVSARRELLEDADAEDIHHYVEKRLALIVGDLAYKLHSGRSRNEQIATDLRLYTRSACDEISAAVCSLIRAFVARAEEAGDAAMPAYTHMQRAEPVLVAHWLLAYVEMLWRDLERIEQCRQRANRCPLGTSAVAGASFPLDRERMARELGFPSITANSVDAVSDRDFVLDFVNALSLMAVHLSRWAEEMLLFSTVEYGLLQLPEAYSTGSSALPQKINGDLLELTRAKAGRIIGHATALLVATKGLPLAYNKDLQETQEPLFDAAETIISLLPLLAGWMNAVEFNFERMHAAAESGCINALAAANYLARKGVPFRIAHEHIGKAVSLAVERCCELEHLELGDLQAIDSHFDADFYECLKLERVLGMHDVPGGTAPERVRQAIAAARGRLTLIDEEAHAHA
ncbi:MAG: argininosuccinate lyase [Acidobacteria bacterium]|nr:argininosuccinate lyase [Acidobacteriota bacterium]